MAITQSTGHGHGGRQGRTNPILISIQEQLLKVLGNIAGQFTQWQALCTRYYRWLWPPGCKGETTRSPRIAVEIRHKLKISIYELRIIAQAPRVATSLFSFFFPIRHPSADHDSPLPEALSTDTKTLNPASPILYRYFVSLSGSSVSCTCTRTGGDDPPQDPS